MRKWKITVYKVTISILKNMGSEPRNRFVTSDNQMIRNDCMAEKPLIFEQVSGPVISNQ